MSPKSSHCRRCRCAFAVVVLVALPPVQRAEACVGAGTPCSRCGPPSPVKQYRLRYWPLLMSPQPARLAQVEPPPSASPSSSFATAFVVLIVTRVRGEEGRGEAGAAFAAGGRVSVGTRPPRRELRCGPLPLSAVSASALVSAVVIASSAGGGAACPARGKRFRHPDEICASRLQ